jgi:hypothetical protein
MQLKRKPRNTQTTSRSENKKGGNSADGEEKSTAFPNSKKKKNTLHVCPSDRKLERQVIMRFLFSCRRLKTKYFE